MVLLETSLKNMTVTSIFLQSRRVVEEMAVPQTAAHLMDLASTAVKLFDHHSEEVHNKLVVGGADQVLVACLDQAVTDPERRGVIDLLQKLLTMLYRCGEHQFQDSVAIVGGDLFPPLLATLFLNETEVAQYHPSAFALMDRLNQIKLNLKDVPWSKSLLNLLQQVVAIVDPGVNIEPLSFVMRWLVEGLLLRRDHNKLYIMKHPRLFESIIEKFSSTFRPGRVVNLHVSTFLRILSLATVNRALMVQKADFFRLLFLLWHDDSLEVRKEVLETLKLIALDKSGRSIVLKYLEHRFVDFTIDGLQESVLRGAALRLIAILLNRDTDHLFMTKCPDLMAKMMNTVSNGKGDSLLAAQTAARLASLLSVHNEDAQVLDTIIQLCSSRNSRIRHEGAGAMLKQAESSCASNFFIAHVPEALHTITQMTLDEDQNVRRVAIGIVSNLASNSLNATIIAQKQELLDILAAMATSHCDPMNDDSKQGAIIALIRLVVHQRSIEAVAKRRCVLRSLPVFGLSADKNRELKTAALRGVARLSPYL